jgi:tetratricopeptide (TPR) repeat protein
VSKISVEEKFVKPWISHDQILRVLMPSALLLLLSGCASTGSVVVRSEPPAAKVFYVDLESGQSALIGETPLTFERNEHAKGRDVIQLRIEKEGFQSTYSAVASFQSETTFVDVKLPSLLSSKAEVQQAFDASRTLLAEANRLVLAQRFSEALARVEKVIELDPRSSEALAAKGSILYLMRDFEGARVSWTRSLEMNPSQASVREAILDLSIQLNGSSSRMPASAQQGGKP